MVPHTDMVTFPQDCFSIERHSAAAFTVSLVTPHKYMKESFRTSSKSSKNEGMRVFRVACGEGYFEGSSWRVFYSSHFFIWTFSVYLITPYIYWILWLTFLKSKAQVVPDVLLVEPFFFKVANINRKKTNYSCWVDQVSKIDRKASVKALYIP